MHSEGTYNNRLSYVPCVAMPFKQFVSSFRQTLTKVGMSSMRSAFVWGENRPESDIKRGEPRNERERSETNLILGVRKPLIRRILANQRRPISLWLVFPPTALTPHTKHAGRVLYLCCSPSGLRQCQGRPGTHPGEGCRPQDGCCPQGRCQQCGVCPSDAGVGANKQQVGPQPSKILLHFIVLH